MLGSEAPSRFRRRGSEPAIKKSNAWGYACILAVVLLWGSAASVGRYLGEAGSPLTLSIWRLALGLVFLGLVRLAALAGPPAKRGARRRAGVRGLHDADSFSAVATSLFQRWLPVWIAGILGYGLMIWLFFAAARTTLASHIVLILSLAPVSTMLIARLTGDRQAARGSLWPTLLCLGGVTIMAAPQASGSGASLAGDVLAVLAMFSFSAYTVLTKRYGGDLPPLQLNTHGMSAGLLFLWALLAITEKSMGLHAFDTPGQWTAIVYLGAATTGLAYLLYTLALARLPMDRVMPFIFLQPAVGVLLSAVWLAEALTLNVALGMCAIIGGLFWNHASRKMSAQTIGRDPT
ncbi:DMT family transporter [Cohnella hashimotonis]|uniref:DMT family transporter n=1 Tax=Cohnella hashimotonis TaxID=2826895 RepID=A0ABT6TEA0_9BACL|nr:DMT family transporter [Cohnella hashimotonis]MDI4645131.1 DMT family transporter [Cohnella hashimotonis]